MKTKKFKEILDERFTKVKMFGGITHSELISKVNDLRDEYCIEKVKWELNWLRRIFNFNIIPFYLKSFDNFLWEKHTGLWHMKNDSGETYYKPDYGWKFEYE